MPSNAYMRFDNNATDVDLLTDLYEGTLEYYKEHREAAAEVYEVLFRSAIVLIVSHWEAYVEDICSEALDHILTHIADPGKLPKEIRKQVAKEIKQSKNDIAMWELANEGWKKYLRDGRDARNRRFNTPKASGTAEFIKRTLGLEDIREAPTGFAAGF